MCAVMLIVDFASKQTIVCILSVEFHYFSNFSKVTWTKSCFPLLSQTLLFHLQSLGNSRKYPYQTTDGFYILTLACLCKF